MILNFISMKEQAPETDGAFIVHLKDGTQKIALYYADENGDGWYDFHIKDGRIVQEEIPYDSVTEWAEVPERKADIEENSLVGIWDKLTDRQIKAVCAFISSFMER